MQNNLTYSKDYDIITFLHEHVCDHLEPVSKQISEKGISKKKRQSVQVTMCNVQKIKTLRKKKHNY